MFKQFLGVFIIIFTLTVSTLQAEEDKNMFDALGEEFRDVGTVAKIMAKYTRDPLIGFFQLHVFADGAHVTLRGEVETDLQFERAVLLALSTEGVTSVDATGLHVQKSDQPIEDLALTAQIKARLISLALFEGDDPGLWTVKVESKNKVVFLTGTVESQEHKQKILDAVKSIPGIESLQSDIAVDPIPR